MGIQDLEMELIHEIIVFSTAKSRRGIASFNKLRLSALRLVCKLFKCVVEPLLFSDIKLYYNESRARFYVTPDYLEAMASPTSPVCCYARSLTIGRIQDDFPPRKAIKHVGCSPKEVLGAITCLTNLSEVHWDMRIDRLLALMMKGLTTLPHLEELHLDCEGYRPVELGPIQAIAFQHFPCLKQIHISGSYIPLPFALSCIQEIHGLLASGRQVSHLSLAFPARNTVLERPEHVDVLQTIFEGILCGVGPPLRSLKLVGCGATLDNAVLPHLSNLSSLDVSYSTLHGQANEAQFWHALRTTGIHLARLTIAVATAPVLKYLASFSGLQHFTARGDRYPKSAVGIKLDAIQIHEAMRDAQKCSRDLVDILSQKHSGSLVAYLSYNTVMARAPSCMTPGDMAVLKGCSKLRRLAFAFRDIMNIDQESEFVSMSRMIEDALCFPDMSVIEMTYSIPTNHGPRMQRTNDGTHRRVKRAREQIMAAVCIPASEENLSTGCKVYFNRQSYSLCHKSGGGDWSLINSNILR